MKKVILFSVGLIFACVTLIMPVLARDLPQRVTVYSQVTSTDPMAYHNVKVVPINNQVFGCQVDETYSLCTYLNFYFVFEDIDDLTGFSITLSRRFTTLTDSSTSLKSVAVSLYHYENGTFSSQQNIRTSSYLTAEKSNADGVYYYNWTFTPSEVYEGKNAVSVIIPFNSFVWGPGARYVFMVDEIFVNGQTIEEIEVNQISEKFQASLARFQNIEDQLTANIPVEDIRNYLQSTDGDTYFSSFQYLIGQSTLLSSLISIVALFGIIGFIIYGKKV